MIVVEPVVNEEKLAALLAEQCESEALDYKDAEDLTDKRSLIEITKDIAALQAVGGYLVIGVDGRGVPTGKMIPALAKHFDEATLRPMLAKFLAPPINLLTAEHSVDGKTVVLVYVAPHPDGFAIIDKIGQYSVPGKPHPTTVFQPGDVFVRHGTSSERWRQTDLPRLFQRRDARLEADARTQFSRILAEVQQGQQGQQIASGPAAAFTWEVDTASFEATATELARRDDRAPIRLLLLRMTGDADHLLSAGEQERLGTLLDRLTSLTAITITLDAEELRDLALDTLVSVYRLGFTATGQRRTDLEVRPQALWLDVATRVEALGALAVRLHAWKTARALALQPPLAAGTNRYLSWLRHGLTEAANVRLMEADGQPIRGSLIALGRNHIHQIPALRPDRWNDESHDPDLRAPVAASDMLLDSLCQFDALWCLVALTEGGSAKIRQVYTSFAAYYPQRTEPVIVRLVEDQDLRNSLFKDGGGWTLHSDLKILLERAHSEGWNLLGDPWELDNPQVDRFLSQPF